MSHSISSFIFTNLPPYYTINRKSAHRHYGNEPLLTAPFIPLFQITLPINTLIQELKKLFISSQTKDAMLQNQPAVRPSGDSSALPDPALQSLPFLLLQAGNPGCPDCP